MKKQLTRNSVKEAIDNLPSGVCYFDEKGLPILCNRVMQNFVYTVTGHSMQLESDLSNIMKELPKDSSVLKEQNLYVLSDDMVWKLYRHNIMANKNYTQYFVEDVTELYFRKKELSEKTNLYRKMVSNIKNIVDNIVAITREEEIFTMKMQVHGKVGWFLQRLRKFHGADCPVDQKAMIVQELRTLTNSLYKEMGNTDEVDAWIELLRISEPLGITVKVDGKLPESKKMRSILTMATRECISNTIRHAEGNCVYVKICDKDDLVIIHISNNGNPPEGIIKEGGEFSSLRKNLERDGCQMEIQSQPSFVLKIWIPREKGECYDESSNRG